MHLGFVTACTIEPATSTALSSLSELRCDDAELPSSSMARASRRAAPSVLERNNQVADISFMAKLRAQSSRANLTWQNPKPFRNIERDLRRGGGHAQYTNERAP